MLKQVDDKSKVLSFAMAGIPVYRKVTRCGKCGAVFWVILTRLRLSIQDLK